MRGGGRLLLTLALALAALQLSAQQDGEGPDCRPDELDLGEYCAGLPRPADSGEASLQRLTPFRVRSMMPGRVGQDPEEAAAGLPAGTPDVSGHSGYGVQIGVFTRRATAESVARQAAQRVPGPYRIAPLAPSGRILWASVHGPFPDRESAVSARQRLVGAGFSPDVFVKPLEELKLVELNHASTQE